MVYNTVFLEKISLYLMAWFVRFCVAIVNLIGEFVKNSSRIRCVVKLFMVIYRILVCLVDALAQLRRGNFIQNAAGPKSQCEMWF